MFGTKLNYIRCDWKDVEDFVKETCNRYKDKQLTGVFGPPRGGLVFAVMISHRLGIPLLMAPAEGCLIVDDISDTGESLIHYQSRKYQIATMFYNQHSSVIPDYWWKEHHNDEWIIYPWEEIE